jgi:hypothetical protein
MGGRGEDDRNVLTRFAHKNDVNMFELIKEEC